MFDEIVETPGWSGGNSSNPRYSADSKSRRNTAFIAVYCGLGTNQSFEQLHASWQKASLGDNGSGRNVCHGTSRDISNVQGSLGQTYDIDRLFQLSHVLLFIEYARRHNRPHYPMHYVCLQNCMSVCLSVCHFCHSRPKDHNKEFEFGALLIMS